MMILMMKNVNIKKCPHKQATATLQDKELTSASFSREIQNPFCKNKTAQIGKSLMSNIFQQSTLSKLTTMWLKHAKFTKSIFTCTLIIAPRTFHCKSRR